MKKKAIKHSIDFLMAAMLPVLMAYELVGAATHEWVGIGMFLVFLFHQIMNIGWYRNLTKGRYTCFRVMQTSVNFLLLCLMAAQLVGGLILSKHLFPFLQIEGGASPARNVHMLAGYWSLVLMSLHLGFHWRIVWGSLAKHLPGKQERRWPGLLAAVAALYGCFAFYKRQLGLYLFLIERFVFFDFEEPLYLFFLDYIAIMAAFVWLGYFVTKGLRHLEQNHMAVIQSE